MKYNLHTVLLSFAVGFGIMKCIYDLNIANGMLTLFTLGVLIISIQKDAVDNND